MSAWPLHSTAAAAAAAAADAAADAAAIVLVVDDDADVRRAVARLMRSAGWQARTFAKPAEFLRQELPAGPACLVLDMYMDEMTGLEVQAALRARPRHLPVVFVSGQSTVSNAAAGFKAGAEDFLEKPIKPDELVDAVRRALARDATRRADRADLDDVRRRYDELTPREQEVMVLVVAGLLNKQVAGDLGISEKTVKVHRGRVTEKLAADSVAELVRMADMIQVPASTPPGTASFRGSAAYAVPVG
jgi:FixJ family two-component response regulator